MTYTYTVSGPFRSHYKDIINDVHDKGLVVAPRGLLTHEIMGAVITMFDRRNKLSESVMGELYQYFPNRIFRSVIPRSVRLAEAPSYGRSILQYDPKSKGGRAYEGLAREVMSLEK